MTGSEIMKEEKKGGFFSVPFDLIHNMIADQATARVGMAIEAEEILAYICLCRGAGKYSSSGWTEHAIATYCEITQSRARRACQFLEDHGYITKNPSYRPVRREREIQLERENDDLNDIEDKKSPTNIRHKYFLSDRSSENFVFLPNCIVDGGSAGKKVYPLATLLKKLPPSLGKGISTRAARMDAVFLLLVLYLFQDLKEYGGVDRRVWSRLWPLAEDGEGLGGAMAMTPIDDTGYSFFEVVSDAERFHATTIEHFFSYIAADQARKKRLEFALSTLYKLRFTYEVMQVWSVDRYEDIPELELEWALELEYPLYIRDFS